MAMKKTRKDSNTAKQRPSLSAFRFFNKKEAIKEESGTNSPPIKEKQQRFYHLIRGKVLLMFALLIVINGIMGVLSYVNIQNLQQQMEDFTKRNVQEQLTVNRANLFNYRRRQLFYLLSYENGHHSERTHIIKKAV